MFASRSRLFSFGAGMQMLLMVLSGVPHLECACHEVAVDFLSGNQSARMGTRCCCRSVFWGNLEAATDCRQSGSAPCCQHRHATSTDKVPDGLCASSQSSCHRKIVPPDVAVQQSPQPANVEAAVLWLGLVAPATPTSWIAAVDLRSVAHLWRSAGLPVGSSHLVLRI